VAGPTTVSDTAQSEDCGRNPKMPCKEELTVDPVATIWRGLVSKSLVARSVAKAIYQAVSNEDYALMQGIFLIIVLAVLAANLCADLVYAALDPRSRRQLGA